MLDRKLVFLKGFDRDLTLILALIFPKRIVVAFQDFTRVIYLSIIGSSLLDIGFITTFARAIVKSFESLIFGTLSDRYDRNRKEK